MIALLEEQLQEIYSHAEEDYPYECCGVIIGQLLADGNRKAEQLLPIANEREEEAKHNRFLISAKAMLTSELEARRLGYDVIGFYHSHPDHPAFPSSFDLEHAWPGYSYIIVAVHRGKSNAITSWRLLSDRSAFEEEKIN